MNIPEMGTRFAALDTPRGVALLRDPLLNKGTAFTEQERDALGLRGLLPAHVLSLEQQAERVLSNLRRLPNDLEKYVALNALHDRNETLFFRVVCDNIDEIQPLIYTPTVGLACQRVRPHLPATARHLHRRKRPGPHRRAAGQLAASGKAHRRDRRRAHIGAGRPGSQRHGHPGRQALALFRLRRRASEAVPAGDAGRRHEQRGVVEGSVLCRSAPASAAWPRIRRTYRRVHHCGTRSSSPAC